MPLAVGAVLVVGPLLGLMMGLVIEYFDVQPFIATLAGMFLARGLCYVISVDTLPIKDPALREFGLNYVYLYEDKFIRWTVVVGARRRGDRGRTCCTRPGSAARCTRSAATGSRHN